MDNIDTLHNLYMISLTAAIIMFVITIVLFFVFDMRHTIGRIFGFSERKAIKQMEAEPSTVSRRSHKNDSDKKKQIFTNTGSLKRSQTSVENSESCLRSDTDITTPLNCDTREKHTDSSKTTLLGNEKSNLQTTVLKGNSIDNLQFKIVKQIIKVNTNEVITDN